MLNADQLYAMKLHARENDGEMEIVRVPGGWIYRFFSCVTIVTPYGETGADWRADSVFVPFDNGFQPKTKAKEPWDEQ